MIKDVYFYRYFSITSTVLLLIILLTLKRYNFIFIDTFAWYLHLLLINHWSSHNTLDTPNPYTRQLLLLDFIKSSSLYNKIR